MARIEIQQGKARPRQPAPGEGSAALAAPYRNRTTGRFEAGNDFSRLRTLRAAYAVGFVGLNPDKVTPQLRPFVELAHRDAARLIEETGAETSPSLMGLAEQAANALAFARGLQAMAAEGNDKAQEHARHWIREYRQLVIALRAEARTPLRLGTPGEDFDALVARSKAAADASDRARKGAS